MKDKKLFRNYLYNAAYQILLMILPLVTSPYIARVLGAENIGIYSYTYSVVFYFSLFANLGISFYGNRMIAKCRDNKEELNKCFSSVLYLHIILSIIDILAYLVFIIIIDNSYFVIALIQLIYLLSVLLDISWFFFGIEEFKLTVGRNTAVKLVTTALIFICVRGANDLWIYTLILTLGTAIGNMTLWMFFPRFGRIVKTPWKDIWTHLKPMAVLAISTIAVSVYLYIDKIMLGKMSSMSQVGYYENAFKMIQFPLGLITAMGTVMLPHISRLISSEGFDKAKPYISDSMKIIAIASPAVAFGLACVADVFSVVFWGEEFAACGPILSLLSITAILISWNNIIRTEYLIPMEKDNHYVFAVSAGALVDVILNALLIPKMGGIGAAIGTVGAYVTVFWVQNYSCRKQLSHGKYLTYFVPFCLSGTGMLLIVRLFCKNLPVSIFGLLIRIIVGASSYVFFGLIYIYVFNDSFYINYLRTLKNKLIHREVFK